MKTSLLSNLSLLNQKNQEQAMSEIDVRQKNLIRANDQHKMVQEYHEQISESWRNSNVISGFLSASAEKFALATLEAIEETKQKSSVAQNQLDMSFKRMALIKNHGDKIAEKSKREIAFLKLHQERRLESDRIFSSQDKNLGQQLEIMANDNLD